MNRRAEETTGREPVLPAPNRSLIPTTETNAPPRPDVLTGFITEDGDAMRRPVGVAIGAQGALLVADDVGNTIWRVAAIPGS
jgi:glucose/arabinose dehydrogenase